MHLHHYTVVKLLDILDTTVKVGAGAALTGLGAVWLARRQRQHDFDKEMLIRRCDALEKITDAFEQLHAVLVDWFAASRVRSDHLLIGNPVHAMDVEIQKCGDKMGDMTSRSHGLIGRLRLLGFTECANAFEAYSEEFGRLLQFGKQVHQQTEWVAEWTKVEAARKRAHTELSKAYLQHPR